MIKRGRSSEGVGGHAVPSDPLPSLKGGVKGEPHIPLIKTYDCRR